MHDVVRRVVCVRACTRPPLQASVLAAAKLAETASTNPQQHLLARLELLSGVSALRSLQDNTIRYPQVSRMTTELMRSHDVGHPDENATSGTSRSVNTASPLDMASVAMDSPLADKMPVPMPAHPHQFVETLNTNTGPHAEPVMRVDTAVEEDVDDGEESKPSCAVGPEAVLMQLTLMPLVERGDEGVIRHPPPVRAHS